jgi:hypothetical protein
MLTELDVDTGEAETLMQLAGAPACHMHVFKEDALPNRSASYCDGWLVMLPH